MNRVRKGCLYVLRPVGLDAADERVMYWSNYLVRGVQPHGCPKNGTFGHCFVESRLGDFIGLVLVNSLQPLDRRLRREQRRASRKK